MLVEIRDARRLNYVRDSGANINKQLQYQNMINKTLKRGLYMHSSNTTIGLCSGKNTIAVCTQSIIMQTCLYNFEAIFKEVLAEKEEDIFLIFLMRRF